MSSFSTALSGLLANTEALNVVGDNLANMNTQGFKSNAVRFEDAMGSVTASLQVGAGVASTNTSRQFTQGSIQTTGGALDAAIQGNGFFVLQDTAGNTAYTRDGSFSIDANGNLVTASGDKVQGWTAANGVLAATGPVSGISVPSLEAQAPSATTKMTLSANLDASAATGASFSTPIQVVDTLGVTHTLSLAFSKTGANAWDYAVSIPGADVTGGTPGTDTSLATGSIAFDSNGKMTTPASTDPPVSVATTTGLASGASDLAINWSLFAPDGTPLITQFAQASAALGTTQDGVQPAQVTSLTLQNGGALVASYSNGKLLTVAQIAVASVSNPDSLLATADNKYLVGAATATPSIGVAGTGQRGNVMGGAIETSNVDMATQFTNLIVFQRGYQANSKVITAIDQMQQTLLALNL